MSAIQPDKTTDAVLADVRQERVRQYERLDRKGFWDCADPQTSTLTALPVLMEEVGEVARSILEGDEAEFLRMELVQVAAVAVAMAESLDRSLTTKERVA